ncbi:MAG TPA: hypothetical protein VMM76_26190 [Pirellulaceae bacterium]|nr:hypothetical protein [Pirellulaceae bacterium]
MQRYYHAEICREVFRDVGLVKESTNGYVPDGSVGIRRVGCRANVSLQVRGQLVEVRVLGPVADSCLDPREMMLDAWVELPPPSPAVRLRARPGKLPTPDAPFIPRDEESR